MIAIIVAAVVSGWIAWEIRRRGSSRRFAVGAAAFPAAAVLFLFLPEPFVIWRSEGFGIPSLTSLLLALATPFAGALLAASLTRREQPNQ